MKWDVLIIGAGASGLMAAAEASKAGLKVCIIEKNDRPGKKLLMTGNGRCNFTNRTMERSCFRGNRPEFAEELLSRFSPERMIDWMEGLGVRTMDRDGYYYPATGQASTVLDCLLLACKRHGVEIFTGQKVESIAKDFGCYLVGTDSRKFFAKNIILACGSPAGLKEEDNREGLVRSLELPFYRFLPALGKLLAKAPYLGTWKGVRVDGRVTLYGDGEVLAFSEGEIQLAEDGISGIPVFQVSRYASYALQEKRSVWAELNFLPGYDKGLLLQELKERFERCEQEEVADALCGLVHKKLILLFMRQAGIRDRALCAQITKEQSERLASALLGLKVMITGTCSLSAAQAAAGGVDTSIVDGETMECKCYSGLYLTGEILDIDGTCGGYNLHFAWMTAMAAVQDLRKKVEI